MKLSRLLPHFLTGILIAACVACGTVPTGTINDQEAIAIQSATAGLRTSTALLQSGKITPDQNAANRAKFDALITGIKQARAANDPGTIAAKKAEAESLTKQIGGK